VRSPYEVLGVPEDASDAEIYIAYNRLTHGGDDSPSPERLAEIRNAYETLSDPARRAEWDAGDGAATAVAVRDDDGAPSSDGRGVSPSARVEREEVRRSRNPIDRLTHRLPRPWRVAIDWIVTIVGAVAIVLLIKAYVVNPYRIPSSSMEPTLHCCKPQVGCEARFSDRVLPGETVRERSGRIYIDGKFLKEPYVQPQNRDFDSGRWFVPKGHYFMMGDNRAQSCDSRRWGSVPRSDLIGPVFMIYWPPNRIGFK
jgi:signal peptidase I